MTFDSKKAHELCERMGVQCWAWAPGRVCEMADLLPTALDRIEEREKALIEERANWIAACNDIGTDASDRYFTDDVVLAPAREQLHAEGLI